MSYEGVKYQIIIRDRSLPADARIEALRKWCRIFHEKDLAPLYPGGTHGNMSYRVSPGHPEIVITAARSSFAEPLSDDSFFTIWDVDFENNLVIASGENNREPSSETLLHFSIYQARPDVQAILHGHCVSISNYSEQMNIPTTSEFVESGTMKIVKSVLGVLGNHSFIEIKDHGFISMGKTIEDAGELAMGMLGRSAII